MSFPGNICVSRVKHLDIYKTGYIFIETFRSVMTVVYVKTSPTVQEMHDILIVRQAAPELKRSVAGFPQRRPGFDPGSGQVIFVGWGGFSPSTSVSPANLLSNKFSIIITRGRLQ